MAIQISSMHQFKMYIDGVMKKAHHHSPNVTDIIPVILGNILTYADPGEIHVGSREGDMKNEIWFCIHKTNEWYYLSYNHEDETIDMKQDGRQGNIIAKFNNQSQIFEIKAVFEKVWRQAKAA